jgi:hypothetical protein
MAVEARVDVREKEMGEMKGMIRHLIDVVADLKHDGKKSIEPSMEESSGASIPGESRLA